MEIFLTIISGVFVFIVSQIIIERIIKPKNEFRKLKGKIICYITMHGRYIANPLYFRDKKDEEYDLYWNASCDLRLIASEFAGHLECYPHVCRKKKYSTVVNNLMRISNNIILMCGERDLIEDNEKLDEEIRKIFNMH